MDILKKINKKGVKINYKQTEEYLFYQENKKLFDNKIKNIIDLIDSNIIIKAKQTKQIIEDTYSTFKIELEEEIKYLTYEEKRHLFYKYLDPIIKDLIYFEFEKQLIYIPFFDVDTNKIYTDNILLTDLKQYKSIVDDYIIGDFRKMYGSVIYESNFTNLVLMINGEKGSVFYHQKMKCLYRFNNDLQLIDYLLLFDKDNKKVQAVELEGLKIISEAYYNENSEQLVSSLYQYEYISEKRYLQYLKKLGGKK